MKEKPRYVFNSHWSIDVSAPVLFQILADVPNYPKWFSLIRKVIELERGSFHYVSKSFLPYELVFDTKQSVVDPQNGILEATMVGDLEGVSRWTIKSIGENRCELLWFEDVVTNKKLLNVLAPYGRPFFRFNHWLAMRQGERGLRTYSAGYIASH